VCQLKRSGVTEKKMVNTQKVPHGHGDENKTEQNKRREFGHLQDGYLMGLTPEHF
jgi:hypothetical protein